MASSGVSVGPDGVSRCWWSDSDDLYRRYPGLVEEFGSFGAYVWGYAPRPRRRLLERDELMQLATSAEAVALSKDLRRRGWGFVGPTTVYSFMQAMGLVNDHIRGCAAGAEVQRLRREFVPPA